MVLRWFDKLVGFSQLRVDILETGRHEWHCRYALSAFTTANEDPGKENTPRAARLGAHQTNAISLVFM